MLLESKPGDPTVLLSLKHFLLVQNILLAFAFLQRYQSPTQTTIYNSVYHLIKKGPLDNGQSTQNHTKLAQFKERASNNLFPPYKFEILKNT